MDRLLYFIVLGLVKFLQALPLRWVARLGRAGGAVAYWIDGRHRKVARRNLAMCLGSERTPDEIRALAKENFCRLGENYCCAIKTASMSWDELEPHLQFTGVDAVMHGGVGQNPPSIVVGIGHFGNFELYARFAEYMPIIHCATTYRGLRQPALNSLMQELRSKTGTTYFERRTESSALRAWMKPHGCLLGLLADQHAGVGGVRIPFFGRECSATASPAVFALRYDCPLRTAICYRVGLAQWRVELGDEIPTRHHGKPREVIAITRDVNAAFEVAIRRDPANWFWVHNRWKPEKAKPVPARSPNQAVEPTAKT